jgi:cytidylate kinase
MTGVTISGAYGAGGSQVAPAVAELLGFRLLDRAISSSIAAQLEVSVAEAEEGAAKRSSGERFLALLAPLSKGVLGAGTDAAPTLPEDLPDESSAFRERAERIMRGALAEGAVILGRAGAAVFAGEPGVLRVRLFGPEQARVEQAARLERVDLDTARARLPEVDRARQQYVRRLYRVSVDDPSLYHLQLDSTALSLPTCARLIVEAYRDLVSP